METVCYYGSNVRIRVLFFGVLRDVVGLREDSLDIPDGGRLGLVFELYAGRFPRLRGMAASVVLALNQEFSTVEAPLAEGDEVAFLPPVSGGSGAPPISMRFGIRTRAISSRSPAIPSTAVRSRGSCCAARTERSSTSRAWRATTPRAGPPATSNTSATSPWPSRPWPSSAVRSRRDFRSAASPWCTAWAASKSARPAWLWWSPRRTAGPRLRRLWKASTA